MLAPWYAMMFMHLERIAHRYGWGMAIHGSMSRDLDVVLIPWTEDSEPDTRVLSAISEFIQTGDYGSGKKGLGTIPPHTVKAFGRKSYAFPIGVRGQYLDVSVIPRRVRDASEIKRMLTHAEKCSEEPEADMAVSEAFYLKGIIAALSWVVKDGEFLLGKSNEFK
jgi:hypothetical protein